MAQPTLLQRDIELTADSDKLISSGNIFKSAQILSEDLAEIIAKLTDAILIFNNKTVTTSAWIADATYADYPYKATISCPKVKSDQHFPEVVFSLEDASAGIFSPVCNSVNDGFEIWASEIPEAAITIPSIKCSREVK